MNILSALHTLVSGTAETVEKPDDSLLLAAKDGKNEKEIIALVRKAFALNSSSRPETREDHKGKRLGSNEASQRPEVVLPTHQIDINLTNERGFTALMYAAQRNFNDLARLLVDKGALAGIKNQVQNTASMLTKNEPLRDYLKELEDEEAVKEKQSAIVNSLDKLRTVMLSGDQSAIVDSIKKLPYPIECYQHRFSHKGEMVTLIEFMLMLGREDVVESFVRAGGDVMFAGRRGRTALMLLIQRRRLPSWPNTTLSRQQEEQRLALINIVLKSRVCDRQTQLLAMDNDGFNALQLAVDDNLDNVVEHLLDLPNLDDYAMQALVDGRVVSKAKYRGPPGQTSLPLLPLLSLLLFNTLFPLTGHRSKLGDTALILAVRKKYHKIAQMLVEKGRADPALSGQQGMTALHWAAFNGDETMIRYLLSNTASINCVTDSRHTPLLLAVEKRDLATVTLLLEFGYTWDARGAIESKAHLTDMERFIEEKKAKKLGLVAEPANPNIASENGCTALLSLCRLAHIPPAPALHTREGASSAAAVLQAVSVAGTVPLPSSPLPAILATPVKASQSSGMTPPPASSSSPVRARSPTGGGRGPLTTPVSPSRRPQRANSVSPDKRGGASINDHGANPALSPGQHPADAMVSTHLQTAAMASRPGPAAVASIDPVKLFDVVALLLSRQADINRRGDDGFTPVIWAVYQNNKPLTHQLINAGADLDILDRNGHPIADRVRDVVAKTDIMTAAAKYKRNQALALELQQEKEQKEDERS